MKRGYPPQQLTNSFTQKTKTKDNEILFIEYLDFPFVLDLPYDSDNHKFYTWKLESRYETYEGNTTEELIEVLTQIIKKYNLYYHQPDNKYKSTRLARAVIYIDNLYKILKYLSNHITEENFISVTVLQHITFIKYVWDEGNPLEMAETFFKNYVKKDEYMYATIPKIGQKRVERLSNSGKENDMNKKYPVDLNDWIYLRSCIQPAVRYVTGSSLPVNNMLAIDINSAYIYASLLEKHCNSYVRDLKPNDWAFHLKRNDIGWYGTFEITYSCPFPFIKFFKDINEQRLVWGQEATCTINLTNVEMELLLNIPKLYIKDIKCWVLKEFDLDYTPEYYRNVLIDFYNDKEKAPKGSSEREISKLVLNSGIYGNTIKKKPLDLYNEGKIKEARSTLKNYSRSGTLPQWGIWAISYVRKIILELGQQLSGWKFSNTDSIYCADTPENRRIIQEYNKKVQQRVKEFCEKFDLNFEDLKELGQFDIKPLKRFRAWNTSQYAYEDADGNVVVKASGFTVDKHLTAKDVFDNIKYCPKYEPTE